MARGRMISKTLSTSVCYARLFDVIPDLAEFAQSLYPLLVAHADDFGREQGDVITVKYRIHPRSPRPEADFRRAMEALDEVGLVRWYSRSGRECYQIVKFDEHQTGLHKRTRSHFPAAPALSGKVTETSGQQKRTELNLTEGKRRERKEPDQDHRADADRVLVRLAHDALTKYPDDAKEELKTLAAKAKIPYDAESIRKALDSAEAQRRRSA